MRFELLIKQLVLLNDTMKRYSVLVILQYKGGFKVDVRFINEQTIMIYFLKIKYPKRHIDVTAMVRWIREKEILEIQDIVPSYRAVLIYFDEQAITSSKLIENLELNKFNEKNVHAVNQTNRIIKIPVQYGGTYGPDIEEVAKHNRITVEQVIEKHTSKPYLIYMLGFMPGFPYLGGLDEQTTYT